MIEAPNFDEALIIAASTVFETFGLEELQAGVLVRDTVGRIKFVASFSEDDVVFRGDISSLLCKRLGPYARADGVVMYSDEPGARKLLTSNDRLLIKESDLAFWLIDRRIVGNAWLETPVSAVAAPPRVVFASLKGGVGRSTALTVTASDLAASGNNVLVVDLDLEAPGLGDLLLSRDRTPHFGVVDYLVESNVGEVADRDLFKFVGTSSLTLADGGRVDVMPALGLGSMKHPSNVLAKLARAMTDGVDDEGNLKTVGSQISTMISRICKNEDYDIVLIDSRAGLAELAAPAVLSLGALVLFFGTAQKQTIEGYRSLFAGLRLLAQRSVEFEESADWRLMLRPVYAKASLRAEVLAKHSANLYDLYAENIYDEIDDELNSEASINFAPDDPDAPHQPLVIPFDSRFVDFEPTERHDQLLQAFFEQTYRPFLESLYGAIEGFATGKEVVFR